MVQPTSTNVAIDGSTSVEAGGGEGDGDIGPLGGTCLETGVRGGLCGAGGPLS
jgi:hypothetical protein